MTPDSMDAFSTTPCEEICPACSGRCTGGVHTSLIWVRHSHTETYGSHNQSGRSFEVTVIHTWVELANLDNQPKRLA